MAADARTELHRLGKAARAFAGWWLATLAGCLPEPLRRVTKLERDQWILELGDTRVRAYRLGSPGEPPATIHEFNLEGESQNKAAALTALKDRVLERSELILRLPAKRVLQRRVHLPLAAEENLREVLGFEMDQHTPFKADQTYYDFRIAERDAGAQRLGVDLTSVPRRFLDGWLDRLAGWGLYPDVIDVAGGNATHRSVNLLPPERRRQAKAVAHRLNVGLAWTAGVLALTAIVLPLIQKQLAVTQLDAGIARVKKESDTADKLRAQIDTLTKESQFLVEQKKTAPVTIAVLDELTRLLPDDTWLYQFEMNGMEIQIQGESSASSAIIGVVEASLVFKNAQFRSPVTQNRTTGSERFNLSAEVVTGPSS